MLRRYQRTGREDKATHATKWQGNKGKETKDKAERAHGAMLARWISSSIGLFSLHMMIGTLNRPISDHESFPWISFLSLNANGTNIPIPKRITEGNVQTKEVYLIISKKYRLTSVILHWILILKMPPFYQFHFSVPVKRSLNVTARSDSSVTISVKWSQVNISDFAVTGYVVRCNATEGQLSGNVQYVVTLNNTSSAYCNSLIRGMRYNVQVFVYLTHLADGTSRIYSSIPVFARTMLGPGES